MNPVLVIGGGLAGCAAALELAEHNRDVVLVEKSEAIGGAVRSYGCMATDRCQQCGLCLVGDLWERVERQGRIKIFTNCQVKDVLGINGDYTVVLTRGQGRETLGGITAIIVAIGFDRGDAKLSGSFEWGDFQRIITGRQLEQLYLDRTKEGVFTNPPQSVAFVQCYGSRDLKQKALYCSRVCCKYSTKAAKVLRSYYPEMRIVFFYMDLQQVEAGEYFESLTQLGIEFIRCRPVRFQTNSPGTIVYEKPGVPGMNAEQFDYIILSEGIHPPGDAARIAEICKLGVDGPGFLKQVAGGATTGIYIAGCAKGPKKIEETYADALLIAREIWQTEA
jgi:heterodisulfide reductase subunit A